MAGRVERKEASAKLKANGLQPMNLVITKVFKEGRAVFNRSLK